MTRRTRIAATAVLAFAIAPATASATTETATGGNVTATFSYTAGSDGDTGLSLQIAQSGNTVYSAPVSGCDLCVPGAYKGPSVHVVQLEPSSAEDVVLDLYTGGAHCCSVEQVFSDSSGTYIETTHNFGDPGEALKDLGHDGREEFVSADDRFAYEFSAFAGSGLPLQILEFTNGAFKDTTRTYPALIKHDAATSLRSYRKFETPLDTGDGIIAAWAADEDNLHQEALVANTLKSEQAKGHISATFIKQLQTFLKHHGYTR
jgi:hypothetical protein